MLRALEALSSADIAHPMMKFGVHEVKVDVAPPQMGINLRLEFKILLAVVCLRFVVLIYSESIQHHGGVFDRGVAQTSIIDSSCPFVAHFYNFEKKNRQLYFKNIYSYCFIIHFYE